MTSRPLRALLSLCLLLPASSHLVSCDTAATDGFNSQTPGVTTPLEAALVINEVVCKADGGSDWIELYVTGDAAVNLADYTLVDDKSDRTPETLPSVTLEPGAYFLLDADGGEGTGDNPSLSFKLGSDDAVTLARDGAIVDKLDWADGDAPQGTSFGRIPDGTTNVATLTPTPGAANVALDGTPSQGGTIFIEDRVLTIDIDMDEADWQAIKADPLAEEYFPAHLTYDGIEVAEVGVRVKGNSSLNSVAGMGSDRFSFRVDINRYVDGQELLDVDQFTLNNGFKDPTLMREHLAYALAREMGMPASRTAFADVTVAGRHLGLYTVVELVDKEFIEARFEDTEGDLYKPELGTGSLTDKGDDISDYPGLELKTNEETSDHSAILNFIDVLNHGTMDELREVLDVQTTLLHIALDAWTVNLDSYGGSGHNYYLYESADGVFTPILWDLNEAFGNFRCGCDTEGLLGFPIDEPTCNPVEMRPLIDRLMDDPDTLAAYHTLMASLNDSVFTPDNVMARVESAAALIRATVAADTTKFYATDQFEQALYDDLTGGQGIIGLENFAASRHASVADQLAGTAASNAGGDGGCPQGGGGGPGPGPGPGPGDPQNPCGDGVCDDFEQNNPDACPQDCP